MDSWQIKNHAKGLAENMFPDWLIFEWFRMTQDEDGFWSRNDAPIIEERHNPCFDGYLEKFTLGDYTKNQTQYIFQVLDDAYLIFIKKQPNEFLRFLTRDIVNNPEPELINEAEIIKNKVIDNYPIFRNKVLGKKDTSKSVKYLAYYFIEFNLPTIKDYADLFELNKKSISTYIGKIKKGNENNTIRKLKTEIKEFIQVHYPESIVYFDKTISKFL